MAEDDKPTVNPGLIARLGAQVQKYRSLSKALETERDGLKAQLGTLTTERDGLKQQVTTPDLKDKKIADLTGQIRLGKHRVKFDALATAAGANPKALDDVYAASGWQAEADEVDEPAMSAALAEVKKSKDYLFAPDGSRGETPRPAPGAGKGGQGGGGGPAFSEDLARSDPAYAMRNYERIREGYKAKYGLTTTGNSNSNSNNGA